MTMFFFRRLSLSHSLSHSASRFLRYALATGTALVMMPLLQSYLHGGAYPHSGAAYAEGEDSPAAAKPSASESSVPDLDFSDPLMWDNKVVSVGDRVRGQVISRHRVVLSSEIAGRITSLPFREGDSFKKGDLLIRLDCTKHAAQRDEAAAEFDQADAVLRTRQALAKHKSTSELELTTAENDYRRANSKLELQNAFVGYCRIVAPFDGSVIGRGVSKHQFVDASEPMLEVLDPNHLEIELLAPSSWLPRLIPGNVFTIHIGENDKTYKVRIVRVVPSIDPVSQSVRIFSKPENTKGLLPGMSGWVTFDEMNNDDES